MMLAKLLYLTLDALTECAVLLQQLAAFERVSHHDHHFVVLERLGDVVERAALHGRNRRFDRGERGDHDDRQFLVDLLELLERRDAVHAREHHVDDGGVEGKRPGQLETLFGGARQAHAIPFPRQQRVEDFAHDLFIVDDEDRALLWRIRHVAQPPRLERCFVWHGQLTARLVRGE